MLGVTGFQASLMERDVFTLFIRNYENPCANYHCRFSITLRDDDRAILEETRDTLSIGTLCDKSVDSSNVPNVQPQAAFQIQSINDCTELVKVFDKYPLRTKKQQDFLIWKEAVAELQKPVDCRDADLLKYYYLRIQEVRKYETQDELPKPEIKKLQLTIEFE